MKAIMISIKPKYVSMILNKEKTIEIRKTIPKCDLPIDVYIYCTKDSNNLLHKNSVDIWWVEDKDFQKKNKRLGIEQQPIYNGKVVAKFTLNKVEEIRFDDKEIQRKACLTEDELFDYLFVNEPYHEDMRKGYAWHIDNLEIFDKPKELSEFYKKGYLDYIKPNEHPRNPETYKDFYQDVLKVAKFYFKLTKAPQNMVYVEVDQPK